MLDPDWTPVNISGRKEKVFVYGTLRKEMHNHEVLWRARYLGEGSVGGQLYIIHSQGEFSIPGMKIVEDGPAVEGEVYEVDPLGLSALDRLEGHPRLYRREVELLRSGPLKGEAVWVYEYQQPVKPRDLVKEGDWKIWVEQRRKK